MMNKMLRVGLPAMMLLVGCAPAAPNPMPTATIRWVNIPTITPEPSVAPTPSPSPTFTPTPGPTFQPWTESIVGGGEVVYTAPIVENGFVEVRAVKLDGTYDRPLFSYTWNPYDTGVVGPQVNSSSASLNGRYYATFEYNGLVITDLFTGKRTVVDECVCLSVAWLPDNSAVLYGEYVKANEIQLYRLEMPVDGSAPVELARAAFPEGAYLPQLVTTLPDGHLLASSIIWGVNLIVDPVTGAVREITAPKLEAKVVVYDVKPDGTAVFIPLQLSANYVPTQAIYLGLLTSEGTMESVQLIQHNEKDDYFTTLVFAPGPSGEIIGGRAKRRVRLTPVEGQPQYARLPIPQPQPTIPMDMYSYSFVDDNRVVLSASFRGTREIWLLTLDGSAPPLFLAEGRSPVIVNGPGPSGGGPHPHVGER